MSAEDAVWRSVALARQDQVRESARDELRTARMFAVSAFGGDPEAAIFICSLRGDDVERPYFALVSIASLWTMLRDATGMGDAEIFIKVAAILTHQRETSEDALEGGDDSDE